MTMTLGQAAKTARKAKGTVLKAIKDGLLTAPKDDKGRYMIDPAELNRVFPFSVKETTPDRSEKPELTDQENRKTSVLEVELQAERMMRERLESEIEDLRSQRDKWQVQAERQTLLLANENEQGRRGGFLSIFKR